jgi:hypothetical protein
MPTKNNNMADITKCNGTDCPLKDFCYRFLCPADDAQQYYFLVTPWDGDECEYFIPNT